jgi:hypothetical protein
MPRGEFDYPDQQFFPERCRDCPFLVGLIEDGYLLGSVTKKYVEGVLASDMADINVCSGPLIFQEGDETDLTCATLFLRELTSNE